MRVSPWLRAILIAVMFVVGQLPSGIASAQLTDGAQTFRDLGFSDMTARSMYGSLSYYFAVPRGQIPVQGSQLRIVFSHSPLLVPDRSTMTVTVNGQSVTSVHLTPENRDRARLTASLPVENFTGNGYFVQLQFHMRLTRDVCEEVQNPALWTTVHADSQVAIITQPSPKGPDLAEVADMFFPTDRVTTSPISFVVPSSPQPAELEAAGLVAFQIGRWSAKTGKKADIMVANSPMPFRPTIAVGAGGSLKAGNNWGGVNWGGQQWATVGGPVPVEHGVLALSQSNPPHLLVSGASPNGVRQASEALVRPERRELLTGQYSLATGAPVAGLNSLPWLNGAASFAQLGIDPRKLIGPGEHTIELPVDRPAGWIIREGSAIELSVETSTAIRSETSWLTAAVNGKEIGTRKLDPGTGTPRKYRFELPVDQLNTDLNGQVVRRFALTVRIYLDMPQMNCVALTPESAWATILPASAWLLPHDLFTGLDLGRFPAPLMGEPNLRSVNVVLPATPSPAEVGVGLQVLTALGHWAVEPSPTFPKLVVAGQVKEDDRKHHLILVGGPDRNPVSQLAREQRSGFCDPAEAQAYKLTANERWAQLCLERSPWARESAILMISGGNAEGLALGAVALTHRDTLESIRGQLVNLVDNVPPQTALAADDSPPSVLAPRVYVSLTDRIPAWQIIGAILMGGLVAAAFIIGSFRWLPRKKG